VRLSERIVDEQFIRDLEGDRRLRRSLEEHFISLEKQINCGESDILRKSRGPIRNTLKRFLFFLISPVLRPFLQHQRELDLERLKLLRDLWKQAEERLTASEERLLQAYIKSGESLAGLRGDILASFNDKVNEARGGAVSDTLAAIRLELDNHKADAAKETRRVAADIIARTDLIADRIGRELEALRHDVERHLKLTGRRVEDFGSRLDGLSNQLQAVRERTRLLARDLGLGKAEAVAVDKAQEGDEEYAAHQDRFRGTPEEIERRQRLYLEHFRGREPVLDVGCGRGEFLSLLQTEGIEASGIDINAALVKACKKRGLKAKQANLFEHCKSLHEASIGGIFAAQVVEHLDPNQLKEFFLQAHRVLKPGGILVAETVNPESVFALTRFYFLDSTHRAPLPPQLLQFIAERAGFAKVEIKLLSSLPQEEMLRTLDPGIGLPPALEETFAWLNADIERLNGFLYGNLEYALIAEK
jgi:SAM-dependent methyltransferase